MINEKEIEAVSLSATKKDFYQTWNELLETASKLSERWDPTSTNESDPGIVLLKVLTAIADKLNYQIDKNTLEAFMPSAAQEESMRKLCDMLGYSMKYYQSATTDVTISYIGEKEITAAAFPDGISIPMFTNIKNANDDVNYFTIENKVIDGTVNKTITVACIEGEVVLCADDTNNVVSLAQLDDNYRYYLPESQIAENGLFIYNINDGTISSSKWEKVDNLNTQEVGKQCYKFGFDSRLDMPYVQFPEDISSIIQDGLVISYTRTNGINGNISYNTLSKIETPALWSADTYSNVSDILVAENFAVKNASAAMNGKNKETINDAYNNYKKTIGTFDTLVTCRDYINKIYQMTTDDTNTTPLVSNINVSDIRDDINRAVTLCTFNEYGIAYVDTPLQNIVAGTVDSYSKLPTAGSANSGQIYYVADTQTYYKCVSYVDIAETKYKWDLQSDFKINKISHFDLVLYPFTAISGSTTKQAYINSFKYSNANIEDIEAQLEDNKIISHKICYPAADEIVCIKNYLRLNAKITTTVKVTAIEEALIKNNVYSAIYENFNARKVDFCEEISPDTIENIIKNADTRIKNVSLNEPILVTKYCLANGQEYIADGARGIGDQIYNKLAIRNILAGRIALFDYNEDFKPSYAEESYPKGTSQEEAYKPIYGPNDSNYIGKITSDFNVKDTSSAITLNENEVIQFRAPNLKTKTTYPAYVNYLLKLNDSIDETGKYATFGTLRDYMAGSALFGSGQTNKWETFVNIKDVRNTIIAEGSECQKEFAAGTTVQQLSTYQTVYGMLFTYDSENKKLVKYTISTALEEAITLYFFKIDSSTFGFLYDYIINQDANYTKDESTEKAKLSGIYRISSTNISYTIGKMIDDRHNKFATCTQILKIADDAKLNSYYIQITYANDSVPEKCTKDGFGNDPELSGIDADEDYLLKTGEFLLINYTPSTTNDDGATSTGTPINIKIENEIIRPNFKMSDSKTYKTAGHTPSKKTGYDFSFDTTAKNFADELEGMYTLNTNEQIERRGIVEIDLDEIATNIYWERNDEDQLYDNDKNYVYFKYNEDPVDPQSWEQVENPQPSGEGTTWVYSAYTLKEGEYIYYTDDAKIDLAYYGNGTKIIRSKSTPQLYKEKVNSTSLASQIASEGLLAALPWIPYNLSGTDRKLVLREYQYVNLTEKDILQDIKNSANGTFGEINKKWSTDEVTSAKYLLYGEENSRVLPTIDLGTGIKGWEVRSILNINVSPAVIQTLHNVDTSNDATKTENIITLYYYNKTSGESIESVQLTPQKVEGSYVPLSFETNYICQTSTGEAMTKWNEYNEAGEIINVINDFKVKLFKKSEVQAGESEALPMNNYGDGNWTKVNFSEVAKFSLNASLISNTHGLIMLYYTSETSEIAEQAYITLSEPTTSTIKICNSENDRTKFENGWWKNYKNSTNYYLKPGLNIVEVPQSCKLTFNADTKKTATLVFSDLRLATYDMSTAVLKINPYLDYKLINNANYTSESQQALYDIAQIDKDYKFYYNAVLDTSTLININTSIDATDEDAEKLSSPRTWYDYNNINNKFVISEIDASYLSTGITLYNSSKR